MSRDETRFRNAKEFVPERFLRDDGGVISVEQNADLAVFGFGRR
jgi:cytochrome P450